jgi:hypothetical protein
MAQKRELAFLQMFQVFFILQPFKGQYITNYLLDLHEYVVHVNEQVHEHVDKHVHEHVPVHIININMKIDVDMDKNVKRTRTRIGTRTRTRT